MNLSSQVAVELQENRPEPVRDGDGIGGGGECCHKPLTKLTVAAAADLSPLDLRFTTRRLALRVFGEQIDRDDRLGIDVPTSEERPLAVFFREVGYHRMTKRCGFVRALGLAG